MADIRTGLRKSVEGKVNAKSLIPVESDEEYYYTVGQLAAYFISKEKPKKKMSSINPFLNAQEDKIIKQRLLESYKKCGDENERIGNMIAMVAGYVPDGELNENMILLGYADDNLLK